MNRETLTNREAEVLTMAATGQTPQEIANVLFVDKRTVDFHLQNAYKKLKVCNRTAAVYQARQLGMIA